LINQAFSRLRHGFMPQILFCMKKVSPVFIALTKSSRICAKEERIWYNKAK